MQKLLMIMMVMTGMVFPSTAQYQYGWKTCTAQFTFSDEDHYQVLYGSLNLMTYNTATGELKIRFNLGLLSETNISTMMLDQEMLVMPPDSVIVTFETTIPSNDLYRDGDPFDMAFKQTVGYLENKGLKQAVVAEYSYGINMRQGATSPVFLNWNIPYEAMDGEAFYVPSLPWHPSRVRIEILDGFVNPTDY